jgi:hypothetical protein
MRKETYSCTCPCGENVLLKQTVVMPSLGGFVAKSIEQQNIKGGEESKA